MLDPLNAIGLASSLLQLTEFCGKLVTTTYNLYKSTDGSTQEHGRLESLIADTRSCSADLSVARENVRPDCSKDEIALQKLSSDCQILADEILGILEGVRVHSTTGEIDAITAQS